MIPYPGNKSRLVLSFDIGTVYSRVSYCILQPGEIPTVHTISRYPTQAAGCEDSNIPTIIYYDRDGAACAIGAQTIRGGIHEEAHRNGWVKAEWLKMALYSGSDFQNTPMNQSLLWKHKSAVDVWADFLGYLHRCAVQFVESNCEDPSECLRPPIEFVISYPSGWDADQLDKVGEACIKGGLVADDTAAAEYIHFVTEGEATLSFLVQNGFDMEKGNNIIIIDAGEAMVACNIYEKVSNASFKEAYTAQSSCEGSFFITQRAHDFVGDFLRTSEFHGETDRIVEIFDKHAKLQFGSIMECALIRFGGIEDEDIDFNIYSGQLRLRGTDVAPLFDPTIRWIIQAIVKARAAAQGPIHSVVLVGGLGRNEYIHFKLQELLQLLGLDLYRPHAPGMAQAVAAGGLSYGLDRSKFWRTSRYSYGVTSGDEFRVILPKGEFVVEAKEFRRYYEGFLSLSSNRYHAAHHIWYSPGGSNDEALCLVTGDVPGVQRVEPSKKKRGKSIYKVNYSIALKFSRTEFNARIAWNDPHSGREKCGPEINIPYVY